MVVSGTRSGPQRFPCYIDERESAGFVSAPTLSRARALTLSVYSYDFFKAELLKTAYFEDNINVHVTASFAAVRTTPLSLSFFLTALRRRVR